MNNLWIILRMVGLTTLETRRLREDMIEVYEILRGFAWSKNQDPERGCWISSSNHHGGRAAGRRS